MKCSMCRMPADSDTWIECGDGFSTPACVACRERVAGKRAKTTHLRAERCPVCDNLILPGGSHAHGDLVVQRCADPHSMRHMEMVHD